MKLKIYYFCVSLCLLSHSIFFMAHAKFSQSKNTWLPRSFGSHVTHDLLTVKNFYFIDDVKFSGHFNLSCLVEYSQNFGCACGAKNLGSMPFWSGTNRMTIGNHDGRANLDAYQLGMGNVNVDANGIAGIIEMNPKIQQVGADFLWYAVVNKQESGFFGKIHLPLCGLIMHSGFKEIIPTIRDAIDFYEQTTLNPNSTPIHYQFPEYPSDQAQPLSVSEALYGGLACENSLRGNRPHPVRIRKGRVMAGRHNVIRLADISGSVGYNFIGQKKGMFGVAGKVSAPLGNLPSCNYMQEPIAGRAGAWGLGAEIFGLYNVWMNQDKSRYVDLSVQAEILHLLPGRRPNERSFDLRDNGPGSKYLLIQNYVPTYTKNLSNEFVEKLVAQNVQPAINLTTLPVKSRIDCEGSIAVMLDGYYDNWNVGIGGEFWGRTAEKLEIDFDACVEFRLPNLNNYAVLGRQCGRYWISGVGGGSVQEVVTNYCEPKARINKSQDAVVLIGTPPNVSPPLSSSLPDGIADATFASNRIPEKLDQALDICAAQAASVYSTKIFAKLGYVWRQVSHAPSITLTGSVELTDGSNNNAQMWNLGILAAFNF